MVIANNTGNVGIGTTSPDAALTIAKGTAGNDVIQSFFNTSGVVKGYIGVIGTAGNYITTGVANDYFIRSQTGAILFGTTLK